MNRERSGNKSFASRIISGTKEAVSNLVTKEDGFLILARKQQQTIVIEGGITITVLEVQRDRVKLGITAPDDIKVIRGELLDEQGELISKAPDSVRQHSEGQNPQKQ